CSPYEYTSLFHGRQQHRNFGRPWILDVLRSRWACIRSFRFRRSARREWLDRGIRRRASPRRKQLRALAHADTLRWVRCSNITGKGYRRTVRPRSVDDHPEDDTCRDEETENGKQPHSRLNLQHSWDRRAPLPSPSSRGPTSSDSTASWKNHARWSRKSFPNGGEPPRNHRREPRSR